jgi:hypothetical protein
LVCQVGTLSYEAVKRLTGSERTVMLLAFMITTGLVPVRATACLALNAAILYTWHGVCCGRRNFMRRTFSSSVIWSCTAKPSYQHVSTKSGPTHALTVSLGLDHCDAARAALNVIFVYTSDNRYVGLFSNPFDNNDAVVYRYGFGVLCCGRRSTRMCIVGHGRAGPHG